MSPSAAAPSRASQIAWQTMSASGGRPVHGSRGWSRRPARAAAPRPAGGRQRGADAVLSQAAPACARAGGRPRPYGTRLVREPTARSRSRPTSCGRCASEPSVMGTPRRCRAQQLRRRIELCGLAQARGEDRSRRPRRPAASAVSSYSRSGGPAGGRWPRTLARSRCASTSYSPDAAASRTGAEVARVDSLDRVCLPDRVVGMVTAWSPSQCTEPSTRSGSSERASASSWGRRRPEPVELEPRTHLCPAAQPRPGRRGSAPRSAFVWACQKGCSRRRRDGEAVDVLGQQSRRCPARAPRASARPARR